MKPLAERLALAGAKTLIYTNIQKDGMQTGVDWENAKTLADQTGLEAIASGGTNNLADVASGLPWLDFPGSLLAGHCMREISL